MASRQPRLTDQKLKLSGVFNQVMSLGCPICYKYLTEPKMLSCGHTFCLTCLSKTAEGDKITCSLCRVETEICNGNADKLPSNIALKSVVEEVVNLDGRCDVCDYIGKPKSLVYCFECNHYMCDVCKKEHNKKEENTGHFVKNTRRSKNLSTLRIERKYCAEHHNKYCGNVCLHCEKYMCEDCLKTHGGLKHKVLSVMKYVYELESSAAPLKENIREMRRESKTCTEQCEYRKGKVANSIDMITSQIEEEYEMLKRELKREKSELVKFCTDLKADIISRSESLIQDIHKCHSDVEGIHRSIVSILQFPCDGSKPQSSAIKTSASKINDFKMEADDIRDKLSSVLLTGEMLHFEKSVRNEKYPIGKLTQHAWVRTSVPLAKPEKKMACAAANSDGKVFIGYFDGGVELFSGKSSESVDHFKDVRVMAIAFNHQGCLVLRDIQNEISLCESTFRKSNANFVTLGHDEGGDGDIAVDEDDNIYASYRKTCKIHVFRKAGGEPIRVIDCERCNPQQILILKNLDIVVMDASTITILDVNGGKRWEVTRKGYYGYPAVTFDGAVLIAWVKHAGRVLEIVKYSSDMKHEGILHSEDNVDFSGRWWFYFLMLAPDKVGFCTPKYMHFLTRHIHDMK